MLRVAHLVSDTQAEGPGRRFAVWVQGCSLRCAGCCNPEFFDPSGGEAVEPESLAKRIASTQGIEGLSVLGGEPFEQAPEVAALCAGARAAGLSVMVFSGYTLRELHEMNSVPVEALLKVTDLLVDGRFDASRPERTRRWIGSSNQVMHFLTNRYSPDDACFAAPNTVELRLRAGQLTVHGWPKAADAFRFR